MFYFQIFIWKKGWPCNCLVTFMSAFQSPGSSPTKRLILTLYLIANESLHYLPLECKLHKGRGSVALVYSGILCSCHGDLNRVIAQCFLNEWMREQRHMCLLLSKDCFAPGVAIQSVEHAGAWARTCSDSQPWLHLRIIWEAFENILTKCLSPHQTEAEYLGVILTRWILTAYVVEHTNHLGILLKCRFCFSRFGVAPKILHFLKAPQWCPCYWHEP